MSYIFILEFNGSPLWQFKEPLRLWRIIKEGEKITNGHTCVWSHICCTCSSNTSPKQSSISSVGIKLQSLWFLIYAYHARFDDGPLLGGVDSKVDGSWNRNPVISEAQYLNKLLMRHLVRGGFWSLSYYYYSCAKRNSMLSRSLSKMGDGWRILVGNVFKERKINCL